jgi:hypothetical protein
MYTRSADDATRCRDRSFDWPANLHTTAFAGTTEGMAKKPTPEISKIQRKHPLAYSRRQRTEAGDGGGAAGDGADAPAPAASPAPVAAELTEPVAPARAVEQDTWAPPYPSETPPSTNRVTPARAHADTVTMGDQIPLGAPPDVPAPVDSQPAPALAKPSLMPGPREIPDGDPEDKAEPPGHVPRGDSRSLRRGNEFALIYRVQTSVISRFGVVGTRGQWRVVEYPTPSAASNSYAKECSRFVAEGFSDYRD